jgi:hypothetical protein
MTSQGLQHVEVPPGHFVPLVRLEDGAATSERGDRHVSVVPKKTHTFRHSSIYLDMGRWM